MTFTAGETGLIFYRLVLIAPGSLQSFPNMFVFWHLRCALSPCLFGSAMASLNHVVKYLLCSKSFKGASLMPIIIKLLALNNNSECRSFVHSGDGRYDTKSVLW